MREIHQRKVPFISKDSKQEKLVAKQKINNFLNQNFKHCSKTQHMQIVEKQSQFKIIPKFKTKMSEVPVEIRTLSQNLIKTAI
jgi:hypothetical protein